MTLCTDKKLLKEALDIPDEKNIHVLLVDATGKVIWRSEGIFAPDRPENLEQVIKAVWN